MGLLELPLLQLLPLLMMLLLVLRNVKPRLTPRPKQRLIPIFCMPTIMDILPTMEDTTGTEATMEDTTDCHMDMDIMPMLDFLTAMAGQMVQTMALDLMFMAND